VEYRKIDMFLLFAVLLCLGTLSGCSNAEKVEEPERPSGYGRIEGSPHERIKWKAADFFSNAGVLALCRAIDARDLGEIERLVKSSVNVNAKGRGNMTPLLWAFPMGELVFEKLLELGADPDIKLTERVWTVRLDKGNSVTSAAASAELLDGPVHDQFFYDAPMDSYLKLVLEHGGSPNIEDANGETPLSYISLSYPRSKLPERLRLLLNAGADINHRNLRGETTIISCSDLYHFVLVLLKHGADYRIVDNDGSDAVLWLERDRASIEEGRRGAGPNDEWTKSMMTAAQPVFDWLADEGVSWNAARAALKSPETMKNLKNLPADYKHRPWLPQRPTLKKPNAISGKQ
jgi:hypothetical protein